MRPRYRVEAPSLTTTTARSGIYILIRRILANGIRVVAIGILARELDASEFGVVAISVVAVNLLTVFGSGGIITYIVCDREPDWETRVNPAFWLNMTLAAAGCVMAIISLPLITWLFPQEHVAEVILICLAAYFIEQAKMAPEALLQRRLAFRALAIRDTGRDITSATLQVVFALAGFGVWSLVLPNLIIAPLAVLFTARAAKFVPRRELGRTSWPRIFGFTKSVMGEQILSYVGNEVDTAIVARTLGSATVGVYNLAYQLANLIGRTLSAVLTLVTTPSLAAAFERKTGLGAPYRKMMRVLSLMTTPLLLGMFVLANELVAVIYGPKWESAVPLLRIFIVFSLVRSVTSPSGAIFNVVGRPALSMHIVVWFLAVYTPALIVTAYYGDVIDIALCVAIARITVGFVSLYISLHLIDENKWRVTEELARPFLAGAVMSVAAWFANESFVSMGWPVAARLVAVSVLGGLVYLAAILVIARRAFDETISLIKDLVRRKRRRAGADT